MPKVESSLNEGGIQAKSKLNSSNTIRNKNAENFKYISNGRNKRDLTDIYANNTTNRRRRVVKKLIRVQLVSNSTQQENPDLYNLDSSTESTSLESTTRRKRRRLKIKKKKRKLNTNFKNISLQEEEHLQQASKPRKKIVITRKRLLTTNRYSTGTFYSETEFPIASTAVDPYNNIVPHTEFRKIDDDEYEDTSEENEITDDSDEGDDKDYNLNYDLNVVDEDYEDSTTQQNEIVTLKESEFFHTNEEENDSTTTEDTVSSTEGNIDDSIRNEDNGTSNEISSKTDSNDSVPTEVISSSTEVVSEPIIEDVDEEIDKPTFQDIPEYEPYFPELTESLDAPITLFKTTVLSSVELLTKTVLQSRLRTYTFVVTTIAGNEHIVTSTTEVKPHTKTTVTTESITKFTTLTLLDIDATSTIISPQQSISSVLDNTQSIQDSQVKNYDEARNLATRVMSNGVEVIVAGDKTIPGEKDFKRFLTSGSYKPVTLKPSTLTENMVMFLPQDSSNIDSLTSSLYPNQFITKTCLTTFTYLTTFLEGSTTTVSSHEQVVSNIATEERNTGKILPTPAVGVTLTQNPNLSVGVFHTTYTYLNTILDGDQPLVVSSQHTVTNTVTAPDDYLALLKVSGTLSPMKDTNTYYSTIGLEKTLYEGNKTSVMSTKEVVTQVVITESVPPRATSVMTSYIALDFKDSRGSSYVTTDVVKTYFVTYTYYNTVTENNVPVVHTNMSVSSDVVTEKLYIIPKTSIKFDTQSKENKLENNFQIFTTKSYLTTFTYFTTLLQEENKETPTVINSRTSVVQNLVSETVDLSLLDKSNLNQIRNAIEEGSKSIVKTITLYNGETFEITAVANKHDETISPTKVLPIEKTQMPESLSLIKDDKIQVESSPSVITGSTIVFIDDDPFAQLTPTPVLKKTVDVKTSEPVTSETVKPSKGVKKSKRSTKSKTKSQVSSSITPTKTKKRTTETAKSKPKLEDKKDKKTTPEKTAKPASAENDLLGLGSINMDSLQAIAPFLNSMAGFLKTNLKPNRRNDVNITTTSKSETEKTTKADTSKTNKADTDQITQADTTHEVVPAVDVQSRSPIYIPVRGLDDEFEIAESQNIASFEWVDPLPSNQKIHELHAHESSLISHGIPISPGDIINTNSDVIVGKPGRVGPRIPAIPLQQASQENEIPVGMKPPPLSSDPWKKKNHEYKRIPVVNNFEKPPQYRQEDYLGPPPPIQNSEFSVPNDNINEISGNAPTYAKNQKNYEPVYPQQQQLLNNQQYYNYEHPQTAYTNNQPVYAQALNHEIPVKIQEETFRGTKPNNIKPSYNFQQHPQQVHSNPDLVYAQTYNHDYPVRLQENRQKDAKPNNLNIKPSYNFQEYPQPAYPAYDQKHNHEIPVRLQEEILTGSKLNTISIKPSLINNGPIMLPEVIERSTGQPLLVNIQPSQVAFVNIPYNRTTALIYGGSTEPHRNGQYFDDPSPYPQPEYSEIEVNDGALPITSLYQPDLPNQKQVNGVIKVENQLVRNDPVSGENQKLQINIQPTKIEYSNNMLPENQLVNMPPVSYGLAHHGIDFNAHVVHHDDVFLRPAGVGSNVDLHHPKDVQNVNKRPSNDINLVNGDNQKERNNFNFRKPTHIYPRPIYNQDGIVDNFIKRAPDGPVPNSQNNKNQNLQKHNNNKKNILRPNYVSSKQPFEISEFMLPPTTPRLQTKRPFEQKHKRPVSIPIAAQKQAPQLPADFKPSYPIYEVHLPPTNVNPNPYQHIQTATQNHHSFTMNPDVNNHKDDDLENEDGEVTQESNSRPLRPGEIPHEIVKLQSSSTERSPSLYETRPIFVGNSEFKKSTPQPNYQTATRHHEDKLVFNNKTVLDKELPGGINNLFNEIVNVNTNNIGSQIPKKNQQTYPDPDKTNLYGVGSHEIVSIHDPNTTIRTTPKPVLIFIDEKEEPKDKFFNKDRPSVTSLPINTFNEKNNGERPSVTSLPVDKFNESNNNRGRPTVTSLPINKFKEYSNRDQPALSSQGTNNFKEINNRDRPAVTSLPINKFKEYNRERPVGTSQTTKDFKDYYRPTVTSRPVNNYKEYNNRPAITSLPIDKFQIFNNRERPPITSMATNEDPLLLNALLGTQTEKPFSGIPSKTISFNEIVKKDVIVPKPPKSTNFIRTTSVPLGTVDKTSNLNTGEIPVRYNNSIKPISDMEIMKPPPLVPDTHKHSTSIKPNTYTVLPINVEEPLSTLYTPNLSEKMVPPPPQTDHKVIGLNPPPLTSPKLTQKTTTPRYSMEVDVPSSKTTTSTTQVHRYRSRRPYTRRPGYRTTTTTSTIPLTSSRKRPVYPGYTSNSPTEVVQSTTSKNVISPSPSIKIKPSLEVIIGNPSLEASKSKSSSAVTEISSSEVPLSTQKPREEPDLLGMESGVPNRNIDSSSKSDIVSPGVHHAGNEIKVVLESTTPLPSTTRTVYNETKSKIPVPTRYITHTKTATVTITKTTVVKSLGMTPSTLTILVTKTEKTTVVDTVTEVHTLVKPTSIIETITTTVKQASSLYPPDAYGSPYPSIQVKPTLLAPFLNYSDDTVFGESSEENLDDFIIHETDPPMTKEKDTSGEDNDSILVIMTDKNTKNIVKVPTGYETQERDEMITTNKDNNIILSGILIDHPEDKHEKVLDRCEPECKASRNELCQKIGGIMRCTCRPGFARMFPDRPCLPTYTYDLKITLDRIGKDPLHFYDDLKNPNSTEHYKFVQATAEALDRMVMQSDLRDIFHGVKVHTFEPAAKGIVSKFHLQLSENVEENRLEDILKKYLQNNSLSLGGTDIFASPLMELEAHDFDECSHTNLHDCSENAHCFNLKGTYSCSCKEGYSDLSENMLYPGRICSAEQVGCEKCNYHGTCYSRGAEDILCECFQWYTGQYCHINLKVLLIALVTLGTLLFGLLLTCIILTCVKGKPRNAGVTGGINFLPQGNSERRNTSDRRAMIQDTSSEEDNKSETSRYTKKQKPAPQKKTSKVSLQVSERPEGGNTNHGISFDDQKDRSLTVMIPRAKYHPAPATSPLSNYTSFDVRKPSVPSISNEAKLLSFLDAGPSPNKSEPTRKFSNAPSESIIEERPNSRKTSGALISAGFEVSATVVNNMGTLGTTCGTEADRSENATLIQKISADLLSSTGTRSQFNTLRKSLVDEDLKSEINMDNASNWLDMLPRVMTVSEARSYDETTIPPPTKCLRTDYDSKPSSQHPNDEANTMAERDLGSTFLLPHTHLYKPDRGSDISGFESL